MYLTPSLLMIELLTTLCIQRHRRWYKKGTSEKGHTKHTAVFGHGHFFPHIHSVAVFGDTSPPFYGYGLLYTHTHTQHRLYYLALRFFNNYLLFKVKLIIIISLFPVGRFQDEKLYNCSLEILPGNRVRERARRSNSSFINYFLVCYDVLIKTLKLHASTKADDTCVCYYMYMTTSSNVFSIFQKITQFYVTDKIYCTECISH